MKTLFTYSQIQNKINKLGKKISLDYKDKNIVLIGILKGCYMFLSDLSKKIENKNIEIDFIQVFSYNGMEQSDNIILKKNIDIDIKNKDVLLVDTICDSGKSFDFVIKELSKKNPKSIKTVVLLDKKCKRIVNIPIDYYGFIINDHFAAGYGLDLNGKYRNISYIFDINDKELES